MGWLSWLFNYCELDCKNHPQKCLREELIKRIADRMVADGYKDAGYEYIIIDDCWQNKTENGKMIPNEKLFKSGMKSLADYVHSKGLKFGMYEDIGTKTCGGYPGLKGHEKEDIDTFAGWEIDYLKVDGCYEKSKEFPKDYPKLENLLNETGRPILYSCSWPTYMTEKRNYTQIGIYCNIWRNYNDISAKWKSVTNIMDWFGNQPWLADTAGPGHFHDPDMLVVGHNEITKDQARVQMAVWSILAGPLMISTDLDVIKPEYKEILLNKDVIAVSQCKLGKMGKRIYKDQHLHIWKRCYLQGFAIAMVNMDINPRKYIFTHKILQLDDVDHIVSDLYHEDKAQLFPKDGILSLMISATGVKYYKFVPEKQNVMTC